MRSLSAELRSFHPLAPIRQGRKRAALLAPALALVWCSWLFGFLPWGRVGRSFRFVALRRCVVTFPLLALVTLRFYLSFELPILLLSISQPNSLPPFSSPSRPLTSCHQRPQLTSNAASLTSNSLCIYVVSVHSFEASQRVDSFIFYHCNLCFSIYLSFANPTHVYIDKVLISTFSIILSWGSFAFSAYLGSSPALLLRLPQVYLGHQQALRTMSSSDDDMPLAASKPRTNGVNGGELAAHHLESNANNCPAAPKPPVSAAVISPKTDAALDKQTPAHGPVQPAIPAIDDVAMPDVGASTNGIKRKASNVRPTFAESESSDDDLPLVCNALHHAFSTLADDL